MPLTDLDASRFTLATTIVAVADVVESVRLMERSEGDFITRWQRFVDFAQEIVPPASGRLHKSLGDGLMLRFTDAHGCVRVAQAMQAWFRKANLDLPPAEQVHLRFGAHVAACAIDEHDIYGSDVNLAARIASLAGPGEIVISAALRQRLGEAPDLKLEDLGRCHLKHVKLPVHAFRVGGIGSAPVIPANMLDMHALRAAVTVLPFDTGDAPLLGVSGDTLADELVTALARSDALQIVSRMPTTAPVPQPSLVRYLLTGSARLRLDALLLHAELADAHNGHVVWADTFQSDRAPHGTVHARLLSNVVLALHTAVIQREVEVARGRPLPTLDEPTLLLAALGLMHRLSPVDMDQSRCMLEHLAERWRRHAMAHAWLAHLHVLRVQQAGPAVRAHDQALARAHAAAGVQCDPESPLVLALDGHAVLHGARNFQGAADRYAQALSFRPDHSVALLFQAELLAMQGAGRKAREVARRASQTLVLEPLRYMYDAVSALAALADHDSEAAVQLAQQSLHRNPRYLPAWHILITAQVETERLGQARASQQQLLKRQPSFSVRSFLEATILNDALAHRFAEALLESGAPR